MKRILFLIVAMLFMQVTLFAGGESPPTVKQNCIKIELQKIQQTQNPCVYQEAQGIMIFNQNEGYFENCNSIALNENSGEIQSNGRHIMIEFYKRTCNNDLSVLNRRNWLVYQIQILD